VGGLTARTYPVASQASQKWTKIMKTRILPIASCLCFLVVLIALLSTLLADGAGKPIQPKIYDESANGDKQVADAIVIAKRGAANRSQPVNSDTNRTSAAAASPRSH
jgi:hypothetical protein